MRKRADMKRIHDLVEVVWMQFSIVGRIIRSWIMWAGHVVQMEEGRMPKKAEPMKRGIPQLRWEDCAKRDATYQYEMII